MILKDSSRPFRLNCVISFIFYLYLILHTSVQRFDVTENLEKFSIWGATKQALAPDDQSVTSGRKNLIFLVSLFYEGEGSYITTVYP
jgi:hypothetical protein